MPDKPAPKVTDPDFPQYPSPDPRSNPDGAVLNPEAPDVPKKTLKTMAQWAAELSQAQQDRSPPGTPTTNLDRNAYKVGSPNGDVVPRQIGDRTVEEGQYVPDLGYTFGGSKVPGLEKGSRRIIQTPTAEDVGGHQYVGSAQGQGEPTEQGPHPGWGSEVKEVSIGGGPARYVDSSSGGILMNNRWTTGHQRSPDDPLTVQGQQVQQKSLKDVGVTLTARAGLEMKSNSANYDVGKSGPQMAAILPGWAQMAAKPVELEKMSAMDALLSNLGVSSGPEETSILAPGIENGTDGSYGQMNNPLDEYSGISAFGMAALSVSLFLATSVSLTAITGLFSLIMKSPSAGDNRNDTRDDERLFLGVNGPRRSAGSSGGFPPLPMDAALVANLLGLRQSKYSWGKVVIAGMLRFYGSDKTSLGGALLSPSSVASMVARAVESPGYYSVTSRAIIRSAVTIVAAVKNIFKGSLFSAVKELIGFFDVMRSSKVIAAMNVFAAIGENALNEEAYKTGDAPDPTSTGVDRYSKMDASSNPAASNLKSRLRSDQGQSLKLAWASNRAVSLLSTPNVLRGALMQGTFNEGPADLLGMPTDSMSRTIFAHGNGRLPIEAVEYIESTLESEYVPFYFHDLRTNEIISFHAFLASLSDDYTAAWDSVDAMGRIEPVKIYKNTSRKIGISFYIVATSRADFNEMWTKINKLTTLVYPQFTEGRVVQDSADPTSASNRFVVPFTQLVGASPLIRLRLGDLFRSNYSKFALARLFGLGSKMEEGITEGEKLMISGESFMTKKMTDDMEKKAKQILKKVGSEKDLANVVFLLSMQNVDMNDLTVKKGQEAVAKEILEWVKASGVNPTVKITSSAGAKNGQGYLSVKPGSFRPDVFGDSASFSDGLLKSGIVAIRVPASHITAPPSEISKYVGGVSSGNSALSKFNTFMNDNAITRSFRDSGGKGLAGVIESLNFDWYDRVPWEIDKGSKAPILCKATISFSPIHDIPPGLDHNGYNRAPIYQVGPSDGASFKAGRTESLSQAGVQNILAKEGSFSTDAIDSKK